MRFSAPLTLPRGAALAGLMLGALITSTPAGAQERFGPLVLAKAATGQTGVQTGRGTTADSRNGQQAKASPQRRRIGTQTGASHKAADPSLSKAQFVVMPWSVGVFR